MQPLWLTLLAATSFSSVSFRNYLERKSKPLESEN
jgi:hypothetical protein